jgi:hypothetical protein
VDAPLAKMFGTVKKEEPEAALSAVKQEDRCDASSAAPAAARARYTRQRCVRRCLRWCSPIALSVLLSAVQTHTTGRLVSVIVACIILLCTTAFSVSVVSSPLTPPSSAAPAVKKEEEAQDGTAAATASPFFLLPCGKAHGAADGWNDNAPGFWHNTRLGPGRHSGETDPDRHTRRPTHHGAMKCARCFHYFKLSDGVCANCGARAPSSAAAW